MKKRIVLAAALLTICLSACAKESTETGGKVEESTKEADVTEESTQVADEQKESQEITDVAEESAEVADEQKESKEVTDAAEESAETIDAAGEIPEAYKKIIEDYIEKFPWNENSFQDASWVYMYYTDLGEIGYALVDIDKNGVEELLIGDTKLGSQDKFNSQIIDGYTIVGDKAVHILTSGERWTYHLCKNGELVEFGSSSAYTTSWDKYVMDKDGTKLSFVESLVLDGYYAEQIGLVDSAENADENNSWFYTDIQGTNYEGYVHISAEIAAEKKQAYEDSFLNIEYIPLSEYSVKAK